MKFVLSTMTLLLLIAQTALSQAPLIPMGLADDTAPLTQLTESLAIEKVFTDSTFTKSQVFDADYQIHANAMCIKAKIKQPVTEAVWLNFKLESHVLPQLTSINQAIALTVKAPAYTHLSLVFEDAKGQRFAARQYRQRFDNQPAHAMGWLDSFLQQADSSKRFESAIAFPVRFTAIQLRFPEQMDLNRKLEFELKDFAVVQCDVPKQQIQASALPKAFANVYQPGDEISLHASVPKGQLHWQWMDGLNQIIDQGQTSSPLKLQRKLDQVGHFSLVLQQMIQGKRVDTRRLHLAVLPPATRQPHERIGLCAHFERAYYTLEALDLYKILNLNKNRGDMPWHAIEKQKDQFTYHPYAQNFLKQAKAKNIRGLTILNGKPDHYKHLQAGDPELAQAFSNYGLNVIDTLKGYGSDFELWNEWSHGTGKTGKKGQTPQAYADMAAIVIPIIRSQHPNIYLASLGGENPYRFYDNIVQMLKAGAAKNSDAISLHPYRQPYWPESDTANAGNPMDQRILEMSQLSQSYGGPENVLISELGYPTHRLTNGVSLAEQARYTIRCMAMLHALKQVDCVYWYSLRDETEIKLRGHFKQGVDYSQRYFGLFYSKEFGYQPKPAAVALAMYARLTSGCTFEPIQRLEQDIYRVPVTQPDGKTFSIYWTTSFDPRSKTLPKQPGRICNLMGTDLPATQQITITVDPMYVFD
ncbi:MAG: hypothetical protein ACF8OB_08580 [Phycisphaeraceae bacterium JB051]